MNGTTVHGVAVDRPAEAHGRRRATTSGTARSATSSRSARDARRAVLRGRRSSVWVAARSPPTSNAGMSMTFFEIDPVVDPRSPAIPRYFTYLVRRARAPDDRRWATRGCRSQTSRTAASTCWSWTRSRRTRPGPPAHGRGDRRRAPDAQAGRADRVPRLEPVLRPCPAVAAAAVRRGLTILERAHDAGAVQEPGETPSHWLAASRDAASDRRAARRGLDGRHRRPTVRSRTTTRTCCPTSTSGPDGGCRPQPNRRPVLEFST